MSVHAVSAAFKAKTPTTTCKLVLLALANYADAENRCFPSVKKLIEETGLSDRAIRNAIRQLGEAGLVEKTERRRANGTQTSDEFLLCFQPARDAVCTQKQTAPDTVSEPDRLHEMQAVQTAPRAGPTTFEPSLDSSVPDGTEAEPKLDLEREAWSKAVMVLKRGRLAEPKARTFFGKLLKDHPGLRASDLLPSLMSALVAGTEDPQSYLVRAAGAVAERRGGSAPQSVETWDRDTWIVALEGFRDENLWSPSMGPEPGKPGCRAPPDLVFSVLHPPEAA